jgi:hypothetical protein
MGETRKCNGSILLCLLVAGERVIGAVVADCAAATFIDGFCRFMSTMHAALTQFVN